MQYLTQNEVNYYLWGFVDVKRIPAVPTSRIEHEGASSDRIYASFGFVIFQSLLV